MLPADHRFMDSTNNWNVIYSNMSLQSQQGNTERCSADSIVLITYFPVNIDYFFYDFEIFLKGRMSFGT